jgi:N,N'-diacetylbacillosaminyl-diphospho-undecaprenol alpha-1,3-N-acetylgalactosaminyltransferase
MKALLKSNHKVFAICPQGDKNRALQDAGCEVINYEIDRKGLNPFSEKKSIDNIYNAIKPLKLDLLHTFTAKPNIYGTFAAKKANIPVIINLVEGLGSFYIDNSIKNILIRSIIERLYKKAFRLSDKTVFVNSDDPQYMLSKKIITKDKVKIIKSVGVDTEYFNPKNIDTSKLAKSLHVSDKIVVLMVARAIWHKGVKEFYESAKALKRDDVAFILVGDTDEGNHSCADRAYLNSGDVLWLGHRDDILELTALADIYVLPSYREGVPRTLLEAASMAKPIVSTDVVGCREVVDDGYNGILVPPRSSDALSRAIAKLIEDSSLRETMGKNGRIKAVKEFDIKQIVAQYLELYSKYIEI